MLLETQEIHVLTAWRQLAKHARVNPAAEEALISILEQKIGALAEFRQANGHQIYWLPRHLQGVWPPVGLPD